MTRGDVAAVAHRGGQFTGKPGPAVIVQSDALADLNPVVICPVTFTNADAPLIRLQIEPSETLPLQRTSWSEAEMITAVRRNRIGPALGRIRDAELARLNGALALILGLASAG